MQSQNKKIIINCLVFFAISLAFCLVLIWPVVASIQKNSKELFESKKEYLSLEAKISQVGNFKDAYSHAELISGKTDEMLIDPEVPLNLITFWEDLAKSDNLSIEISSTSPLSAKINNWNPIGFQLVLSGSLSNFLKFLEESESSPYLINGQSLSLQKIINENNGGANKQKIVNNYAVKAVMSADVYSK